MTVFPHHELRYYGFGVRAGVSNLLTNGLALGARKTAGKITQPINAHTRFAEYDAFDRVMRPFLDALPAEPLPAVLDVGSPKLFGLRLAHGTRVALTMTDISEINIDEYRVMWRGLASAAKGRVTFALQDARSLEYADATFDAVYSMSVIEHVDGERGDARAIQGMLRVLKPGGLFVMSVPFGPEYREQHRIGFAGAVRSTGDEREYFFQRIYDRRAVEQRIVAAADDLDGIEVTTVARRNLWLARAFGRLGENVRGALGFLNPLLSAAISRTRHGIHDAFPVSYGALHQATDVYGDLILSGRKR